MAHKKLHPYLAALPILVPLYVIVVWFGWTVLTAKPPQIMGEHYEEVVAQNTSSKGTR